MKSLLRAFSPKKNGARFQVRLPRDREALSRSTSEAPEPIQKISTSARSPFRNSRSSSSPAAYGNPREARFAVLHEHRGHGRRAHSPRYGLRLLADSSGR